LERLSLRIQEIQDQLNKNWQKYKKQKALACNQFRIGDQQHYAFSCNIDPEGRLKDAEFYPMADSDKATLIDVIFVTWLNMSIGKELGQLEKVSFREIESYLRDQNNQRAFPTEELSDQEGQLLLGVIMQKVMTSILLSRPLKKPLPQALEDFSSSALVPQLAFFQEIFHASVSPEEARLVHFQGNQLVIFQKIMGTYAIAVQHFLQKLLEKEFRLKHFKIVAE
jgi:hypothetical protein